MERVYERCCALDVHKEQVTACVHVPNQAGERAELGAEFGTMTADLPGLCDWLKGLGVTHVAMEATGVYWKPVYYLLEDDFELLLVNAQHVKNVPGRKTDVQDAQWLCQLLEHGLLGPSFVPPKPMRELRDLTRYRKSLVWERQREQTGCRSCSRTPTSSSATWPRTCSAARARRCCGRSARATLTRRRWPSSPRASCARSCRRSEPRSRAASERTMPCSSRTCCRTSSTSIEQLTAEIEQRMRPFESKRELLCTIPGVAERTAEVILAEFGPDMERFPSHRHAASWAAICPGQEESAGKRRSGKTRKGDRWLRTALVEAAQSAAGRTKDTYLRAQYLRIKRRRGHKKAIVAVAHSILVSAYHVLNEQRTYEDLGGD